jgi:hypothetical protein
LRTVFSKTRSACGQLDTPEVRATQSEILFYLSTATYEAFSVLARAADYLRLEGKIATQSKELN